MNNFPWPGWIMLLLILITPMFTIVYSWDKLVVLNLLQAVDHSLYCVSDLTKTLQFAYNLIVVSINPFPTDFA